MNFSIIKRSIPIILIACFVALPLGANEESKQKGKEKKYSSQTGLSLVLTRGNNKTFSFSFDTEQNLLRKRDKFNFKGSIIHTSSNNEKQSEIYYSHLKYERKISARAYLLGFMRAERNKQAGYNFRFMVSAGAGYAWIQREKITLSSEGSIGWSGERNLEKMVLNDLDNSDMLNQKTFTTSFLSSIISNKLIYNFTSDAQFVLEEILFVNMSDFDDYRLNVNSSVSASISRYFALKTSIKLVYEHQPVPGFKNTDFYLLSSIVVKI